MKHAGFDAGDVRNPRYALEVLTALVAEFPGLVDGDTEINGSDLVESLSAGIDRLPALKTLLGAFVKPY